MPVCWWISWAGIASGQLGCRSIPGDDIGAVNAKQKKNQPRLQDYEGTQPVPGNSGDDDDERGNEGHVHRVINSRRSMGLCEKIGWEVERITESIC